MQPVPSVWRGRPSNRRRSSWKRNCLRCSRGSTWLVKIRLNIEVRIRSNEAIQEEKSTPTVDEWIGTAMKEKINNTIWRYFLRSSATPCCLLVAFLLLVYLARSLAWINCKTNYFPPSCSSWRCFSIVYPVVSATCADFSRASPLTSSIDRQIRGWDSVSFDVLRRSRRWENTFWLRSSSREMSKKKKRFSSSQYDVKMRTEILMTWGIQEKEIWIVDAGWVATSHFCIRGANASARCSSVRNESASFLI